LHPFQQRQQPIGVAKDGGRDGAHGSCRIRYRRMHTVEVEEAVSLRRIW
jgi:hypothetical protein